MQYLLKDIEIKNGIAYGTVYAVSKDQSTFGELVDLEDKLQEQGIKTMVDGEYSSSIIQVHNLHALMQRILI